MGICVRAVELTRRKRYDSATLVNKTLFQYKEDNLHTLVYWSEVIEPAISFENRTELHLNFDVPIGGSGAAADGKRVADGCRM